MTVVSYAHEMIFLKTRKTAGTSMELWLSAIAGPRDVLTPFDSVDERTRSGLGLRAQNSSGHPWALSAVRTIFGA